MSAAHTDFRPADWLNQIHHGDCLELMRRLPDECVDIVVTSPPYNLRSGGRCRGWPGYDGYGDDLPHDVYVAWQQECLREMHRIIKPTGAIFYNHAPRIHQGVQWRHEDILEPFDVRQTLIWHRAGGVNHNPQYLSPSYEYIYVMAKPGFRVATDWTMGDVWKMGQEKRRWIPEVPAFPVELPQNAIRATGAKVVLDCFMGSGTTAVAAVLEGADYIGIEQSARYCAVARERVASIPPGGEPVEPPALYTKSRPQPGRTELGGKAGVVYQAIRERIEAAGLYEINLTQVSLAQDIAMPLKTVRRAVEKIRNTKALIVTNRGASTGFALPISAPHVGDSAMFVTPIKSGPMNGPMEPESGPMALESGLINGPLKPDSGPMALESGPMNGPMEPKSGPMEPRSGPMDGPMTPQSGPMASESGPMSVQSGPMNGPMKPKSGPMKPESGPMALESGPMNGPMEPRSGPMDGPMTPQSGPMASESGPISVQSGPMNGPMKPKSGPMALESGPMKPESGPMADSYRLTGTSLPVNDLDTTSEDPDRITGSDGPMKVPLAASQRASHESDWPSESAPNPASAWRAVLGCLQLEMPQEHFNSFLKPCVGYAWEDGNLVVAAASAFVVEWLELALHRGMAQEALARTLGQEDANIVWNVMPDLVLVNQEGNPTEPERAPEPSPDDPDYCPEHREPHLRVRSRWYTAQEVEQANDDEIYYCKGGGNQCTWVYSVREGCIWKELADEPLQQAGLRNAYHAKKYQRAQWNRTHRGKGGD